MDLRGEVESRASAEPEDGRPGLDSLLVGSLSPAPSIHSGERESIEVSEAADDVECTVGLEFRYGKIKSSVCVCGEGE